MSFGDMGHMSFLMNAPGKCSRWMRAEVKPFLKNDFMQPLSYHKEIKRKIRFIYFIPMI
jgi:hypothetical protein